MKQDTYILLKDLIEVPAGAIYKSGVDGRNYYCEERMGKFGDVIAASLVENNPEWFAKEEVREFTKEDVIDFGRHIGLKIDSGATFFYDIAFDRWIKTRKP